MPYAICTTCLKSWHYHNRRGFCLAIMNCPACKTPTLKAAAWTASGYQICAPKPRKLGRRLHCGICNRQRYEQGSNLKTIATPFICLENTSGRIYSAGTKVCWTHRIKALTPVGIHELTDTTHPTENSHGPEDHAHDHAGDTRRGSVLPRDADDPARARVEVFEDLAEGI